MAHYAVLGLGNKVVRVFVGRDDVVDGVNDWEQYYAPEGFTVKQTSYNTRGGVHLLGGTALRKNYAGVGYTYDEARDAFIPPKPHASWVLDEATCLWQAPIEYPADGGSYTWNEETASWVEVTEPSEV